MARCEVGTDCVLQDGKWTQEDTGIKSEDQGVPYECMC